MVIFSFFLFTVGILHLSLFQNLRLSLNFHAQSNPNTKHLLMAKRNSKLDETDDDENVFASCTQDDEEIDVAWDWNSPRCKHNRNFVKKKKITSTHQHSPKLTLRRHHSDNQLPAFEKIKEQIAELRKEVIGGSSSNRNLFDDSVFDDSIEEQLVLCSQRVEEAVIKKENFDDLADDSFDLVLEQLDDDKFEQLTQPVIVDSEVRTSDSSFSEVASPIKCSPEEIEQKRLQALERLQAKKKEQIIEKKRQEALKRLEMNKKKRAGFLPRKLPTVIK